MNWYRAKNLILISLVTLNIVLLMLIYVTKNRYTLTNLQVENTYQVLSSKYDIGIYSELPKKYYPLKELEMINEGSNIIDFLFETFFEESESVNTLEDEDKVIFQGNNKTLMTQSGDFVLSVKDGYNKSRDEILKELSVFMGDFFLFEQREYDGYKVYEYRQKFKGQIIYSNYVTIEEVDSVVTNVEGYYAKPYDFIGDSKEIVSVDMALFVLANNYPRAEGKQIFIDQIQLVYNQEQVTNEPGVRLKATPCYLIKIRGNAIPVMIDAYTNTLL